VAISEEFQSFERGATPWHSRSARMRNWACHCRQNQVLGAQLEANLKKGGQALSVAVMRDHWKQFCR